ncbi:MAG: efflux RND transporter periplasmic adaptor subunit [Thermodesulfobacteriota bacterium]|nr:efflux RND transporter periplasmic adaptor subunit [Thermodesulfobacteriota bacterium]
MSNKTLKAVQIFFQIVIVLMITGAGIGGYLYFINHKPAVKQKGKEAPKPVFVDVLELKQENADILVQAMGEVRPSKEIELNAEVSGEIVEISDSFYPGGVVKKGDILVKIDQADFLIAVEKSRTRVKKARASLELEQGKQKSAEKELLMYEKSEEYTLEDRSLALRKPQLASAQADLESAVSDLNQARLDLSRTIINAPFDAIVIERHVNQGSCITTQETLASLYGTDTYWVTAFVPSDRIPVLSKKTGQAEVVLTSQTSDIKRKGRLKSITGRIAEKSRLAEVLIEIDDPLGLESGSAPLLAKDYVALSIKIETVEEIIALPRKYVRDNHYVWIYDNDKLKIKRINIFWKNRNNVLVREGLFPGEKIITSAITIPVDGMPVAVNLKDSPLEKK